MAVPGRSASRRPNSSAAERLAVRTLRSRPVTTTASASAATISAARPDLLVLREPTQRLLGDLLRHALHRVVRRRHRLAERRGAAHLGEVSVELLYLVNHGLRGLEAHPRNIEAISHRAPHGVVPALDPDVVPEERLAVFR